LRFQIHSSPSPLRLSRHEKSIFLPSLGCVIMSRVFVRKITILRLGACVFFALIVRHGGLHPADGLSSILKPGILRCLPPSIDFRFFFPEPGTFFSPKPASWRQTPCALHFWKSLNLPSFSSCSGERARELYISTGMIEFALFSLERHFCARACLCLGLIPPLGFLSS